MKITKLGVITALKNLGLTFLLGYSVPQIQAEPTAFIYAFLIYAIISIPTDLYLLNHIQDRATKQAKKELEKKET